jgi:iron complex outermembrane recepter protein
MTVHTTRFSIALLCTLALWRMPCSFSQAIDSTSIANGSLEEILVTAQRQQEKLVDVPMSVSAFGKDLMDREGIRSIDDLSRVTPGVTFVRNGMSATTGNYNDENADISIRGIDSSAGASTTGIYIDDTPIQTRHLQFGTLNPYPALFDLERVEVLRGPQGTLFGVGSEGGTIRFITPEPDLAIPSVYVRTEIGQIESGGQNYEAGVALGTPVIDDVLGLRMSASYREDGGWVDRVNYIRPTTETGAPVYNGKTETNANWHDTQTFRLAFKWAPTSNLSVSPSIYAQTLHINDTGAYWTLLSNQSDNTYYNANAQRDPSTDPWYLGAIKVDWNMPFAHLVSNTSYFSRSQHSVSDYTQWINTVFFGTQFPPPADDASAYFQDRQNNFTQEIRISSIHPEARFTWNGGIFYSRAHENTTETVLDPSFAPLIGAAPPYPAGGLTYTQPVFSVIDKQIAAFGELTAELAHRLKVTAGVRVAKLDYTGVAQESGLLLGGLVVNGANSGSDKPITPRFVLSYESDLGDLYYVSAAKGSRPGGINTELPTICTADLPTQIPTTFKSDSLWQYELGSKTSFLDHRLQINASIYYYKWKNIQQNVFLSCGLEFVPNLGDVVGKGGDVAIQLKPTSNSLLELTAAYTDAAYTGTVALAGIGESINLVTNGDHLPSAPWNITASGEYLFSGETRKPYIRFDYQLTTSQHSLIPYQDASNAPNDDPSLPGLPATRVLALRGGLRFSGLDVSLFVQNALDFRAPVYVSRDSPLAFDTNYFARGFAPRTLGLTATYRY